MITKDNFKKVLRSLGFEETADGVFVKTYHNLQTFQMKADFNAEHLEYAQGITADRDTTKDFHQPENFVVFTCVCQLLAKGYSPSNIILEASAGADGRGQTNTYLDILVKDNYGNGYLIIECKTADGTNSDEFAKAWRKVTHDGGQLFNYFTLFRTPHLCLYACDFIDGCVKTYSHIIILKDENLQYLDDTGKEGYRDLNATAGQNDYFRVWTKTYEQAFLTSGIFDDNAKPYEISTKITRTFDELEEMDDYLVIQRKYNEFATIMRQHNVGSRENAFDKLVNLFLAKIVDEEVNREDLKFNWKTVAFDDYYSFQDRLQELYTIGMDRFLGEHVSYINEKQIKDAFVLFKNDPDATRDKILDYFRQQKFYTNNDFAFLDVHNKNLFFKNMAVLIKIVQMLQDIRLKSDKENQFLGDLFEGFLDQGVKQSEGQFFTPIPIVKFLISSLPIREIVSGMDEAPHVIDYACGAGHFLNEIARQISKYAKPTTPIKEYYSQIVGIEKEYRLSKVAKVSAFMYNQDDIRIVYGDALADNAAILDNSFHILVANPPYSVKGFLETLSEGERKRYELFSDELNLEKNNSIETFFIERAKQLLVPGGACAIILPSSVLSNGGIYIACREILLKYFDIVAISEFSSGTFGKTGTNTVTLFMRRKQSDVDIAKHLFNRAAAWTRGDYSKDNVFNDAQMLNEYCQHCGLDAAEYRGWAKEHTMPSADIFSEYVKAAKAQSRYKAIAKKKITQKYTIEQQTEELKKFVTDYIETAEREKIYYFLLALSVRQPVLIIKSPTDNKAIKTFLGYEWSGAKGSEGIKYLGQSGNDDEDQLSKNKGLQGIQTPLFDPNDLDNPDKINILIRKNFLGEDVIVPNSLSDYVSQARLVDMIDFKRTAFDKEIRTSVKSEAKIESKWPLVKLGDIVNIKIGGTPNRANNNYFNGQNLWVSIAEMNGQTITDTKEKITDEAVRDSNVKLIPKGTVLLSFKLSIGKTAIAGKDLYTNEAIAGLIPQNKNTKSRYLFYLFSANFIQLNNVGDKVFGKSLNSKFLREELRLPLPPLTVQQQIVTECEAVDADVDASRETINEIRAKTESLLADVQGEKRELKKLCLAINPSKSDIKNLSDETVVSFVEMSSVSNDGYIEKKIDRSLKDVRKGSYTYFAEGDIILAKITPCMENGKCALATGLTNGIGMGSSEFHVFRCDEELVLRPFLFAMLNRSIIREAAEKVMTGASGHRRVPISFYEDLLVPVPPISTQQHIVSEIEAYEVQIAKAKAVIDGSAARKQAILDKYLK